MRNLMVINIFLVNKIKEFIVLDYFDLDYKKLFLFLILTNTYKRWMIAKTYKIFAIFPFVYKFLDSTINYLTLTVKKEIAFEKPLIHSNSDFWKFYDIEILIFFDNDIIKNNKKYNLLQITKFICTKILRCKNIKEEKLFSSNF